MQDKTTSWANSTHSQWWRDPGLRKNVFWVILLYLGSFVVGYDSSLSNGLQALPQWNASFDSLSGVKLGLMSSSLYLAEIVIALFVPYVTDRYGRKKAIFWGSFGLIIGAIVTVLATSAKTFILGRVIIGMSVEFPALACMCLVNEIAHPRLRGGSGSYYMSIFNIGALVAACFTFATIHWDTSWAWRLPVLFQAFGPLVLLFGMFWCPESPRWLVSKGRHDEALTILAIYHANGDRKDELVLQEFGEISASIERERATTSGSWKSLIATPGNRHRMAIVVIAASGAIITGIAPIFVFLPPILRLVGINNPTKIATVNAGISLFNLLMSGIGAFYVDKIGRRPLYLVSTVGMLLTYPVLTALSAAFSQNPSPSVGVAFVVMLFAVNGSYDLAWLSLGALYPVEILPFSIRSKAMSIFLLVTALCLALSNLVSPIALAAIQWRYYTVYSGIQAIYLALIWWLFIETRGRTIEQVGALFDEQVIGDDSDTAAIEKTIADDVVA